jgi:hypothetical protein
MSARGSPASFLSLAGAMTKRRGENTLLTICQLPLVISVLIRARWVGSSAPRERLITRVLALIEFHQNNFAVAKISHTKKRKGRLRKLGVTLGQCTRCEKLAL